MRKSVSLTFIVIFCVMAFFCAMTPWVYDDYGYGSGNGSFAAMFASQWDEYQRWSGKFVGHFIARVLLHGATWLHPLLSALVFCVLIWSGLALVFGTNWRKSLNVWHTVIFAGLVWFAIPGFGTVFFWRTGTPDYGYSLTWATLFLVAYRFWLDNKNYQMPLGIGYVFLGFFAGCSNENIGMLSILTALTVVIFYFFKEKRTAYWALFGILGAVAGWLFMMCAPGSTARLAQIGGPDKIPLLSGPAFTKFLVFWGTQQLELLPFTLPAVGMAILLFRHGQGRKSIPGLIFLLMSQASLGAFLLSPSTPVRAMTTTFFYAALSLFAFVIALDIISTKLGKGLIVIFSLMFCISVVDEIYIFLQAQPAIAARNQARSVGKLSATHFDYPATDKYFFATYDIKEAEGAGGFSIIPWENAQMVQVGDYTLKALVISNMLYLDNLPHGHSVKAAGEGYGQTVSFKIQWFIRKFFPLEKMTTSSTGDITSRYITSNALLNGNTGQAMIHLRGVTNLDQVAYIAIKESGMPLTWQRVIPCR